MEILLHIPPKDVSFVCYGNTAKGNCTIYNPFKVNSEKVVEVIHRRECNEWITAMKWGNDRILLVEKKSLTKFKRCVFCVYSTMEKRVNG
ncbi:hypothetical protein GHT06_013541 [Daphnia sinensis]|uniref:Uncharacterized protein n=1 Tax=Daphnia sinensis TaxID=1820382 RepID=A0AAD5KSD1_9CRUS|nr:hypothetical protein GHT06_013541 [Daphnia sinensis]